MYVRGLSGEKKNQNSYSRETEPVEQNKKGYLLHWNPPPPPTQKVCYSGPPLKCATMEPLTLLCHRPPTYTMSIVG